jgi:hypothetical protein
MVIPSISSAPIITQDNKELNDISMLRCLHSNPSVLQNYILHKEYSWFKHFQFAWFITILYRLIAMKIIVTERFQPT